MKTTQRLLLWISLLAPFAAHATPGAKLKPLDRCDVIDPKTTLLHEVVAKVATTADPQHRKALEVTIDYAKPGSYPGYMKTFGQGLIDLKKISAVRLLYRSNSDTSFSFELLRTTPRKDGKAHFFWGGNYKATKEWS
jgi:hypothetical protein